MIKKISLVIFLLLNIHVFSQQTDINYTKQWNEIDTLIIKKDLPKTALEKVMKVYTLAQKQNNYSQQIKSLIYKLALEEKVSTNKPNNNITVLKTEIEKTNNKTVQSILHSLLAQQYNQYFKQNSWRIYNRSNTNNYKKNDIETWNTNDFNTAINYHFKKSIENIEVLKKVPLNNFSAIIIRGNASFLRPTLFDVLAHAALDYFKTGNYYITKPTYTFELKNIKALLPAQQFIKESFTHADSTSHLLLSLQLFQQLIALHLNDENKNALVDVDLERIEWVNSNLVNDNKDDAYVAALQNIIQSYLTTNRTTLAYYLLASYYNNKGRYYEPYGDTTNRYCLVKAISIINNGLLQYTLKNNEGVNNLLNLKSEILSKQLSVTTEKVNIPNLPFRALINFTNIDSLFVKIIPSTSNNNNIYQLSFSDLVQKKSIQSFSQKLPVTNDYQPHSTEIKIDGLPVGEYILLTSSSKNFNDSTDKLTKQILYISNISYATNGHTIFVLNRTTGEPLPNVKADIWINKWNSNKRVNERILLATQQTNSNGFFPLKEKNNNYEFAFTTKNDSLHIKEFNYIYDSYFLTNDNTKDSSKKLEKDFEINNTKLFFFTDRSIYRPGQTLYFKGIAITKEYKTLQSKLFTISDSIQIKLYDVNRKAIDSIKCKLNEYGSISGKFIIPTNVLTGYFSIETNNLKIQSKQEFSVEEYKRPTFYIDFENTKNNYQLNDLVTITGYAKTYSGTVASNAKVKYTIIRKNRFIYDWARNNEKMFGNNAQEISFGETVTDASGKFEISFKTLADDKINKATDPLFDFLITADITDINGETRSKQTTLTVGYKALLLNINCPTITETDSLKNILITTKNLSNETEAAIVTIKIYSLQTPERLIRKRLWSIPDTYVFDKQTYLQYFPEDEYANESNYKTWAIKQLTITGLLNTANNSVFSIDASQLNNGYYKIIATTTDKYGNEIKDEKYIMLFSKNKLAYPQINFNYTINNTIQPNEIATFLTGTYANKLFIIQQKQNNKTNNTFNIIQRTKGIQQFNYTATEADRGNISFNEMFIYHNRFYNNQFEINIPYNNKELQIEYSNYRNKTEPGNKETFTITVKGNNKNKVAAEVLTTMYDASLDQFRNHNWAIPNIWNLNKYNNQFNNANNFSTNFSYQNFRYFSIPSASIIYDKMLNLSFLNTPIFTQKNKALAYSTPALQESIAGINSNNQNLNEVVNVKERESHRKAFNVADNGVITAAIQEEDYDKVYTSIIETDSVTGETVINGRRKKNITINYTEEQPQIRKNFNETAFFFPALYADSLGNYNFSFTMPEALTQWKWLSFAHTKDLAFGRNSATITTQKILMVQTNAPRFLREGDNIEIPVKISNTSNAELSGQCSLQLINATTNTPVDGWFQNIFPVQYFTVAANQNIIVKFPIQIPFNYNKPLTWRVIANTNNYSDGEENTLPVLSNRILVTETLPLFLKATEKSKSFSFNNLLNNKSETLSNESLTVEYTANPIWNVIQSLPYLMEYPYECAEQTFNKFYANTLAAYIVNNHPRIKKVFEKWRLDSTALQSNLSKNEELKQILLQETPWVLNAQNENEQRKNIALLFNAFNMSKQINTAIEKLKQMQSIYGGFAWFKGGNNDRYITQYILTGIGKLQSIGAIDSASKKNLEDLTNKAISYCNNQLLLDYNETLKSKNNFNNNHLSPIQIQALYALSYFNNKDEKYVTAKKYYSLQTKKYWKTQSTYLRAIISLTLLKQDDAKFVINNIIPSIKENAVYDADSAMYWKDFSNGYYWYQSPVEQEALMINLCYELSKQKLPSTFNKTDIPFITTWLIKNKQTNNWKTTKATADACFALLRGNIFNNNENIKIQLGNQTITTSQQNIEEEISYVKKKINGDKIKNEMANIQVAVSSSTNNTPSYGAIYWQYFEDINNITASASPLSLTKKLFIEKNTAEGKTLIPINDNDELKIGDKLMVRIELKTDRAMEYLHLKDLRASCTEPINTLSNYKWQDGLGYYESTKDASTNFFINNMQKGTYIFEYPLFVTHSGTFTTGIATIQCMYAPEFSSHSQAIKIKVAEK
ncbi:MAG: alpha-2-macroglobulin [Bacteroidetes bacterium]|nr:alpha-2-macroglobulin [Bacteroidota bacterium]MBS1649888.1 alpha-2-macroglobulin [Bacteroidota bacterium]